MWLRLVSQKEELRGLKSRGENRDAQCSSSRKIEFGREVFSRPRSTSSRGRHGRLFGNALGWYSSSFMLGTYAAEPSLPPDRIACFYRPCRGSDYGQFSGSC